MSTDTFNFVAQVLGSVAAVVALSQAAIHYFAPSEPEQSTSPPSARTAERVVLEFNPNNIDKEGTFEHVLTAYEQKLPVSYRGYIPHGFLGVQKTYYRIFMIYSVVLFSASVLSIISEAWYIITPLFVAAGSICLYLSVEAKRIANNLKEYIGYLHDHKIYLGFEFTQDKVAFEAQKAQREKGSP